MNDKTHRIVTGATLILLIAMIGIDAMLWQGNEYEDTQDIAKDDIPILTIEEWESQMAVNHTSLLFSHGDSLYIIGNVTAVSNDYELIRLNHTEFNNPYNFEAYNKEIFSLGLNITLYGTVIEYESGEYFITKEIIW